LRIYTHYTISATLYLYVCLQVWLFTLYSRL